MTSRSLTPAMTAAILGSYEACGTLSNVNRRTARALIARGLAVAVTGTTTRTNRYSWVAQTVYDVVLGYRLTDDGKAVRSALRSKES